MHLPGSIPGSRQTAFALGYLAKFVTLQHVGVHPTIPAVKKPWETAVQTISRCRRCQGGTGLPPSGPMLSLPTLSPCRLPPCSACFLTLTALGVGKVLLRREAAARAGACKPLSCGVPGQVQCTVLEGREGSAACWGGDTLAFSGQPAASPTRLLPGVGAAKDISLRVGFGSLGCAV